MRVILSGGGTGGHVFPAIAVADCLKRRDPKIEILFVGAKGKMEMERVPKAGYPIKGLWISGFQRRLTLRNLSFPVKLLSSLWKARGILRRFKPDVVIGFGGYASGPLLEMAVRKKIPAFIQEQNSFPGITNRLLAKRVRKIFVAYREMERFFPSGKIAFTGNPVRKDLEDLTEKKEEAMLHFGLDPTKKTILLFGGSLGARTLNEVMRQAFSSLEGRNDIQVLWQIGKLYMDDFAASKTAALTHVHAMQFIERMDLAFAAADIVVCRAGALTISELCLAGKAAILVPSPNVAEDHQRKNAMALVDRNAARFVADSDASEHLVSTMLELIDDSAAQKKLAENVKTLAGHHADEQIVDQIMRSLKEVQ